MRGHHAIAAMRAGGYAPICAFLHVLAAKPEYRYSTDPETLIEDGLIPEIDILPTENAAALDLRCLTGLQVHIVGTDEARVGQIMRRLTTFTPSQIIAAGFLDGLIVRWTPAGYEKLESPHEQRCSDLHA